jgi:hydroxymethylbilane synthase
MTDLIRLGTRGSQLALWQAKWVQKAISRLLPEATIELKVIKTQGDKILDVPLARVGGKSLFVKEIEEALLDGRIDLAVHSMKDMPAELPRGLTIGAVPRRENPLDALVTNGHSSLEQLPKGARVGTSSLRRAAQLLSQRPDLTIVPLRGNLDTRLKKLATTDLDAVVLAAAGLHRLGMADRITEYLDPAVVLPAVGQGALCIEHRHQDPTTGPLLSRLDHAPSRIAVTAERAFLHRLEGGCQIPIAAHARVESDRLTLTGLVAEIDGSRMIASTLAGKSRNAETIGTQLAQILLNQGARAILESINIHAQT